MSPLTYRQAGVNIDAADDFLRSIKPLVRSTSRPEVLGGIGGFSGLFLPRLKGMKEPLLVSSTDGVGTKLMIADLLGKFDTVGIDLVAMNVDDVVVTGAEPLFFLDYIACGKVKPAMLDRGHEGHRQGLPGSRLRPDRRRDGRAARTVRRGTNGTWPVSASASSTKPKLIDGRKCRAGDAVIGLASSGLHSNGYTLARERLHAKRNCAARSAGRSSARPGFTPGRCSPP